MIVINIRGTGGSGKSTLVRSVVAGYPEHARIMQEKRRQPLATCHWFKDARRLDGSGLYEERPDSLLVPGHYETACGGCDTIKTVDAVYEMVRAASLVDGNSVLYEGIMVMDDVTRAVALDADLKRVGSRLVVVYLNTPIEECLAGIRARREAGGNEKPLSEKNTRDRMARQVKILQRLRDAGVEVKRLSRDEGLTEVRRLLGV